MTHSQATSTSTSPEGGAGGDTPELLYMNLHFLRVAPGFHTLMSNEKVVARQEFLAAFDRFSERLPIATYTLTGLRADCDLLLWRLSPRLEMFAEMTYRLQEAGLGKHLIPVHSFSGTVPGRDYPLPKDPKRAKAEKTQGPLGNARYLFVAPADAEAGESLAAAPASGGKLHVMDGRGLDDHAVTAAFETDDPMEFRKLLTGWSGAPSGPVFTCIFSELRDIVAYLG